MCGRVCVCACAKDKHGCQTPEVLAKNQGKPPQTHTHTHMREKL